MATEVKIEARHLSVAESQLLRSKLATFQAKGSSDLFIVKFLGQEHLVAITDAQLLADSIIFHSILDMLENDSTIDEFMFRPIEELELPGGVYNKLKRHGIETFGPLVKPLLEGNPQELFSIRQFGPTALDVVIVALFNHGLAPERFHPFFNKTLLRLIGEEALLAKGYPQARIDAAKTEDG
jgi:hypothetical protein